MTTLWQHDRRPITGYLKAIIAITVASAAGACLLKPLAVHGQTTAGSSPQAGSAEEILNPPAAKLRPRRAATADQRDRALAIRMFTEARLQFHRGQLEAALKKYQRAARIHPDGTAIAREVVPLAAELNRFDMGARYALLAADHPPVNPQLIYRLALAKAVNSEDEDAQRLYEIAVRHDRTDVPHPIALLASLELGRIYYLQGQYGPAAQALQSVDQALQAPADYGLDEELQQMLLADPESTYALLSECYLKTHQIANAAAALERADQVSERPVQLFRRAQLLAAKKDHAAAIIKIDEYLKTESTVAGMEPYALLVTLLSDQDRNSQNDPADPLDSSHPPVAPPPVHGDPTGISATVMSRLEELRQEDPDNIALAVFVAQQYLVPERPSSAQLRRAETILRPLVSEIAPVEVYQGLLQIQLARADWKNVLVTLRQWTETMGGLSALDDKLLGQLQQEEPMTVLRALVDAPQNEAPAEARVAVAQLALRAKQYATAARLLQSAFVPPRESVAVFLLDAGIELLIADQFELAIPLLRKVIASQLLEDHTWATSYYLAGALEMQDRTEEALATIDAAIARTRKNAILLGRKAWILDHSGDATRAAKLYQQIIDRFANDYKSPEIRETLKEARSSLSNLQVKEGRLTDAEELLQQVLDEYPSDPGAMNDLGYLWADQNKMLRRARRLIEQAVQADPENGAYHDSLGWVHYRLGNHATAIEHLEKAASLEQPDPVILEHLGDVLKALDRKADALEVWRQAHKLYVQQQNEGGREDLEKKITQFAVE